VFVNCFDRPDHTYGVSSAAAIDKTSSTIYVAGGNGKIYALDLATGQIKPGWPVTITSNPAHEHVWGALSVFNGKVYAPISMPGCDIPPYNGRMTSVDIATHTAGAPFYVVPPSSGRSGGGIWGWGGASIDTSTNPTNSNVFVATGNALPNGPGEHDFFAEHVVGLTSGLGVISSNYPGLTGGDTDFGATPTLFQAPGCPLQAAVENKFGAFFVYNTGSIQNGPLQRLQIANTGDDRFIGLPAYSPQQNMLYVSNSSDSNDGTYKQGMVALKVGPDCKLSLAWQQSVPTGSPPSPPTVANGVVYYGNGTGNQLFAFDAQTGQQLWNSGSRVGGPLFGASTVVNGQVFAPSWDNKLHSFDATGRPFVGDAGASGVTQSSANLSGTLNPNGQATTYHFEYGTTASYGSQTPDQSAGAGTTDQQVSANLPSLSPNTTYHFRLDATNAGGTTQGQDRTFTTNSPGSALTSSNQFGIPNQTDVFRVGDDGSLQVNWVTGGGAWNGPLQIAPPGTAPANAHLAASQQFGLNQTDLFFVAQDGSVQVVWVAGGGTWAGPLQIAPPGTAPAGANVAASNQFGLPSQTDVFTVGSDGGARVSWVAGGGNWGGPMRITPTGTYSAGAGVAASRQFGLNQTDLFAVGADGGARVSWVAGGGNWGGPLRITPTGTFPAGAPVAASNQFGLPNQTDLFAVGGNGGSRVSWVVGGGNWGGPMQISPSGTAPSGSGLSASNQYGIGNQTDVFVIGGDGKSRVSWVDGGGPWGGPLAF
jgi:outer membrane protein assembly factor BamB